MIKGNKMLTFKIKSKRAQLQLIITKHFHKALIKLILILLLHALVIKGKSNFQKIKMT